MLGIFPDAVNFHLYVGVFVRMLVCIYARMCIIKDTDKCLCKNMQVCIHITLVVYR